MEAFSYVDRDERGVHTVIRQFLGSALVGLGLFAAVGCGAQQNGDDSKTLTDNTPVQLETSQKEKLRNCVLASAERNYARGHSGNLAGTLEAVGKSLETPENAQDRYRARVRGWDLEWDPETIEPLGIRFGTRGLEVTGEAERPADATEFFGRLTTNDELPSLHLRQLRGNDVDGFSFRFVEATIEDLLRRSPDLDSVYARAREMGIEPVLRSVCPGQDDSPEKLPPDDPVDWNRTIRDMPGAWKFSGYETTKSARSRTDFDATVYRLAEKQEFWETIEVELRDQEQHLRIGSLIPDGEFEYLPPNPLPKRLRQLAGSSGLPSWAKFDQCPRDLCGFEPSEFPETGEREIEYLTKLIRTIDRHRAQLYDVQAASWMNRPVRSGLDCTNDVFEVSNTVRHVSFSFDGHLEFLLEGATDDNPGIASTLRNCSEDSVLASRSNVRLENASGEAAAGSQISADLDTTENLQPEIADFRRDWARRDFVDGAEQLRYLVRRNRAAEVSDTLESLRGQIRRVEERMMTRREFIETVSESLLEIPFHDFDLATRPAATIAPDLEYHRIDLSAEASQSATTQFLTLLRNLQEDQLLLVERLTWRDGSDRQPPRLTTTLGVLSRN